MKRIYSEKNGASSLYLENEEFARIFGPEM